MEISVESAQPSPRGIGSVEPSSRGVAGIPRGEASPRSEAGSRPYSFLEACECPDACLRDHANE
jgi:hypothetical protein